MGTFLCGRWRSSTGEADRPGRGGRLRGQRPRWPELPAPPARAQADLGLSDAGLGLVLVGFAGGAMVSSPVAGRLVGTVGSRPVVVAAATVLGASLWLAGAAPQPVVLAAALALIGAADAAMDIAMNANAGAYEALSGRSVMHRLHGLWSLQGARRRQGGGAVPRAPAWGSRSSWH